MGDEKERPSEASLIAEYRVFNRALESRGSDTLLVESIMIPLAIAILTFAVEFEEKLGEVRIFPCLQLAGFIPIMALSLILISYLMHLTTNKLDDIYFDRIHEIEGMLQIQGHNPIRNKIKRKTW